MLFVIDAAGWRGEDDHVLQQVRAAGIPALLAVNKIDTLKSRTALLPLLAQCADRAAFRHIVPLSARRGDNLERLAELVEADLPEGPALYPRDALTDRSMAFRVAEAIREQLLIALRQEVPYGLAIEVLALEERPGLVLVDTVIWASRESHKGIIVGHGGATLKRVGTAARLEMETQFGMRFHLEMRVKVKQDWADSERALQQFGLDGN